MAEASGWRPLQAPAQHRASRFAAFTGDSPFARLALTHILAVAGDTLVTMALAGSLFFSISPHAARGRVALYLVLTMAPFAVVAPVLGPVLDRSRSGRRTVVVLCHAGRVIVCLLMARHLHSLLLFPEAFVVLVLSKAYVVTKGALVPATVADDSRLVEANSRLAVIGVVAGFAAAAPGALVLKLSSLGAPWVLRLAAVVFAAAAVAGVRLARAAVPRAPERTIAETQELKGRGIRFGATAMAVLRGAVGFLTFLLAFAFRRAHAPSWWFGVAIGASLLGPLLGALIAPRVRRVVLEERILTGSLVSVALGGAVCAWYGNRAAGAALAGVLGLAAAAGKLAFDAIVQRDAPDAGRGRAFARFETRFQLAWVAAALPPVLVAIPRRAGMVALAIAAGVGAVVYVAGRRG
ncbi:MAG: Major Facilitator Superfamily transporter [Acidimicrobiales bacterium]|nr:Major Facilitator Superfamily transporter [Acidimicrobiales bacterium]